MQLARTAFLQAALAAGTAPAILPAGVVRAQDGRPTPSNRTTFALIGSGQQGRAGMKQVLNIAQAEVIATCDPFKSRREAGAAEADKKYGTSGCKAYADYRELLERKDLDCVEVATGDHWHVPIALHAVRKGKDVYVEKPLSTSLRWGQLLRDEVKKRNAVFQYGTWQRSKRHFRQACEMIRNKALGDVQRIDVWGPGSYDCGLADKNSDFYKRHLSGLTPCPPPADLDDYDLWLGPAPARLHTAERTRSPYGIWFNQDYAIGFIAGWNVHPLDIAHWAMDLDGNPPVSYKGTGAFPEEKGVFDALATWDVDCVLPSGIHMRNTDSVHIKAEVEKYRPWCNHGTTFWCENGWLSVDRGSLRFSDQKKWQGWKPGENGIALHASPRDDQWADFIESVRTRRPTVNGVDSAFNDDVACHLPCLAAATGREIRWDAKSEKLVGAPDLEIMLDRVAREPWNDFLKG
jgi:predicted dehydrogenase